MASKIYTRQEGGGRGYMQRGKRKEKELEGTRASAKYSRWNKHKSQNQKGSRTKSIPFNLVLGTSFVDFKKNFRADLV
jgi:hypothetical protein